MILSGYISLTLPKPAITSASLPNNNSTVPATSRKKIGALKRTSPNPNKPSLAEVERAIGAGIYRDHDPASETTDKNKVFDVVLSNSIGKTEGPIEKKLRETGELLNAQTERITRSSGKKILEIMFFWIAPTWFLMLLIATGAIKLPSSFNALNDLIM
ncbi:putative NAD(P)H dehydrogenase subunit CRR3, chloroplastic [Silene latifolia]|uniref:putative NAD(P)H dehydrogenase subunit CRR3, chloroplastic n=1 Tax=Silene latifolia TaxID=37657 RepID=UPI003D78389E